MLLIWTQGTIRRIPFSHELQFVSYLQGAIANCQPLALENNGLENFATDCRLTSSHKKGAMNHSDLIIEPKCFCTQGHSRRNQCKKPSTAAIFVPENTACLFLSSLLSHVVLQSLERLLMIHSAYNQIVVFLVQNIFLCISGKAKFIPIFKLEVSYLIALTFTKLQTEVALSLKLTMQSFYQWLALTFQTKF